MAHKVSQDIPMPELDRVGKQAILQVNTYRFDRGGIYSSAHVHFIEQSIQTYELFGDFSKRLEYNPELRATKNAIERQHERIFTSEALLALKVEVRNYYARKATKTAVA